MKLNIHFEHLEPTDAIKTKINEKSEKLKKFFNGDFEVQWHCSVTKDRHRSHVSLIGDHLKLQADSEQDNLYKTFDDVVNKLEKQLSKAKTKSKNHIHQKNETQQLS